MPYGSGSYIAPFIAASLKGAWEGRKAFQSPANLQSSRRGGGDLHVQIRDLHRTDLDRAQEAQDDDQDDHQNVDFRAHNLFRNAVFLSHLNRVQTGVQRLWARQICIRLHASAATKPLHNARLIKLPIS